MQEFTFGQKVKVIRGYKGVYTFLGYKNDKDYASCLNDRGVTFNFQVKDIKAVEESQK